jgi:hypothetical protein
MLCARAALCALFLLSAAGCGDLLSLHPLVSPEMRVFDPAIEGVWRNTEEELRVTREGDHYDVIFHSTKVYGSSDVGAGTPNEDIHWQATLTDLNDVRFADLLAPDTIGHMFARVQVNAGELRLAFFDSEWLRARVPHEEADLQDARKQAVLTASTPQLRRMLAKYVHEAKAFDAQEHIWRK